MKARDNERLAVAKREERQRGERVRRLGGTATSRRRRISPVRKAIWAFENDADAFESLQSSEGVWFPFEDNHSPSYGIEGTMRIRDQWLDAWDEYRSEIEAAVATRFCDRQLDRSPVACYRV